MTGSSWILVLTLYRGSSQPLVSSIGLLARRTSGFLHIDGGKTTVGDGTADSTGKGESRVEVKTAGLLDSGLDVLLDGVHLDGAGRGGRGSSGSRHWTRSEGSGDGMDWSGGGTRRLLRRPIFRTKAWESLLNQHAHRPITSVLRNNSGL